MAAIQIDTSNFVEGKQRCPFRGCNSSDGFHWYGEGKGGHCFACEKTLLSDEKKEELGIDQEDEYESDEVVTREAITPAEAETIRGYTTFKAMGYRGIRDETYKFFGIRHEYNEDGTLKKQFYPTTIDGQPSGYKTRRMPKDFTAPIGQVGKECDMFGEVRFPTATRTVIIAGGETKVASTYQMLKDDIERRGKDFETPAVVCSTLGESGAHKQVQQRYEFFNQFSKIIVCMDNDKAGKEAAEKIAKVLPKGRVYIMNMRLKDSDDYIKAGKEKDFVQDFWNAAAYTPAGVVGSGDLPSRMREEMNAEKIAFPPFMTKINEMTAGGLSLGKICNIGAASGLGKTVYVDTIIYHLVFNSPHRVGVVSMELNAGQYGVSMLSRHIGRKISNIANREERLAFLDSDFVKAKERELFFREDGSHRFHLVDDRDGSIEDLKSVVEQLVIGCDCKVIVLDPIQDILDGLSNEEQALFLKWQKGLIKSHNISFININHVRKSGGGGQQNSAGGMIAEEDFSGSSTIFKSAALNILLVRDKMAEDPIVRNTTKAYVSKNRDNGITGPAGEYYYDNDEHRLYDKEEWLARQPAVDFTNPDTGEVTPKRVPAFKVAA
jgi:hypothetical protein